MVKTRGRGLQRSVSADATVLPRDLLEAIACKLISARDALALERTNNAWRSVIAGLDNSLWRQLTMTRFPRLAAILRCSAAIEAPSFRTLYRSQLEAELAGRPKPAAASATLKDFILTLEIHVNGQLKASWTGSAVGMCQNYGSELKATFASFGPEDGPAWFNATRHEILASEDGEPLPSDGATLGCVATLYATRQLKTVQLYKSAPWALASREQGEALDAPLCFPPKMLPCQCQALTSITFGEEQDVHRYCNNLKPPPELQIFVQYDGAFALEFGYFDSVGATWCDLVDVSRMKGQKCLAAILAVCANEHVFATADSYSL